MTCGSGWNWAPIDGELIWLSAGQGFDLTLVVDEPWPVGTTSAIDVDGALFAAGSLSADRYSFRYLADAAACDAVADRGVYLVRLLVPDASTSTDVPWNWILGEIRRKDAPWQ